MSIQSFGQRLEEGAHSLEFGKSHWGGGFNILTKMLVVFVCAFEGLLIEDLASKLVYFGVDNATTFYGCLKSGVTV